LEAAAAQILDGGDASLLTHKDIQSSYGSSSNFMMSYGLKAWNPDDVAEARSISQALKCCDASYASSGGCSKRGRYSDEASDDGNERVVVCANAYVSSGGSSSDRDVSGDEGGAAVSDDGYDGYDDDDGDGGDDYDDDDGDDGDDVDGHYYGGDYGDDDDDDDDDNDGDDDDGGDDDGGDDGSDW
jgi:hypothetical protein